MNAIWTFYFGWYQGAVYSNLLASGICGLLVLWRAKVHIRRSHGAAVQAVAEQNAAHKQEIAQMLTDHHAAVVAAVTPSREGP